MALVGPMNTYRSAVPPPATASAARTMRATLLPRRSAQEAMAKRAASASAPIPHGSVTSFQLISPMTPMNPRNAAFAKPKIDAMNTVDGTSRRDSSTASSFDIVLCRSILRRSARGHEASGPATHAVVDVAAFARRSPAGRRPSERASAQNAFAADFHSWRRCAISSARSSSLPVSSSSRSAGSARR